MKYKGQKIRKAVIPAVVPELRSLAREDYDLASQDREYGTAQRIAYKEVIS